MGYPEGYKTDWQSKLPTIRQELQVAIAKAERILERIDAKKTIPIELTQDELELNMWIVQEASNRQFATGRLGLSGKGISILTQISHKLQQAHKEAK